MEARRRAVGVVVAVVVLAGLPIARPAAQTQCSGGDEALPGPLCATLQPPNTFYEVLDIDPGKDRISWSGTTISCGNFYGSSTGLDANGEAIEDETDRQSFWGHANGEPDNCSHNAPDHPGSIVADVTRGEYFSNLRKIHIPGELTRCTYSGSASGTGPPCGPPPPQPTCVSDDDYVAISTEGASVELGTEQDELIVDFPGSGQPGCNVPLVQAPTMTILGGAQNDIVTVDMDQALIDLFRQTRPGLGINLGEGVNEIRLRWSNSDDRMTLGAVELPSDFPGFEMAVGLDVTGDGVPDIGIVNSDLLKVDFGGGNDRSFIDGSGIPVKLPLVLLGKAGEDRLVGGAANDKLNGGPARDVCKGGKGRDSASNCETTKAIP